MADRSPDIFDTEEESGRGEENEEEEPEEETGQEEKEEKEEEKEGNSSSSEEETEVDDDEPDYDPWDPIRQRVGEDLKESYTEEVKRFLDRGKSKDYSENAAFNALLPLSRRRLRRTFLQRLKWSGPIVPNATHFTVKS